MDADIKKLDIKQGSQTLTEFETVMADFPKAREFFSLEEDIYNLYRNGSYVDDIVSMAYQRIGTGRTLKELRLEISKYSLKDCSETIADYYMNGYNASILSRQIMNVLKRRTE